MRREIKRETMMFTDLPRELESEILSWVPAKSLYQLRFTCRRWYALFKDPRFIKENLGKAATQVILKKDFHVHSVSINIHGTHNSFDPSIECRGTLKSRKDSKQVMMISYVFHCDGLLLCLTIHDNRLVVWNPCTGQTRWVQPSNRNNMKEYCVLGYKNNDKSFCSYKILKPCCYFNDIGVMVVEFEIYDFNSDSWRVLDDADQNLRIKCRGVSLKGNTYWVASDIGNPLTHFLLRFDFKSERFERFSLPFQFNAFDVNNFSLSVSVAREEKLYVLLERRWVDSLEIKIWVIDEAKGTTNIHYFLEVDFGKIMITGVSTVESFLVDEENKKIVFCRRDKENRMRTIIYIVGGDHNIHVCKQRGEIARESYDYWPLLVSYVPSLIQIQQLEANVKGDFSSI